MKQTRATDVEIRQILNSSARCKDSGRLASPHGNVDSQSPTGGSYFKDASSRLLLAAIVSLILYALIHGTAWFHNLINTPRP